MSRRSRKSEHVRHALHGKLHTADFSDIILIHNCLPDLDLSEVFLITSLAGLSLHSPLFINAITGGTESTMLINRKLAEVANKCNLAMAVGSQTIALENKNLYHTFEIVREINPDGIIFANIGAYATPEMAETAVKMISADGLQLHLNVAQELFMKEGDSNFKNHLQRIKAIINNVDVPVIVKEVGFGIAYEQAEMLINAGVKAIDVGGYGGTNFIAIESRRRAVSLNPELLRWGIPTAVSLIEVLESSKGRVDVIAAGGMTTSLNIAKALALGANSIGLAGLPIRLLLSRGKASLIRKIKSLEKELRLIMLMTGARTITELQKKPVIISGLTAEWLEKRGINTDRYARRS